MPNLLGMYTCAKSEKKILEFSRYDDFSTSILRCSGMTKPTWQRFWAQQRGVNGLIPSRSCPEFTMNDEDIRITATCFFIIFFYIDHMCLSYLIRIMIYNLYLSIENITFYLYVTVIYIYLLITSHFTYMLRGCSKLHSQYDDHIGGFWKLDMKSSRAYLLGAPLCYWFYSIRDYKKSRAAVRLILVAKVALRRADHHLLRLGWVAATGAPMFGADVWRQGNWWRNLGIVRPPSYKWVNKSH